MQSLDDGQATPASPPVAAAYAVTFHEVPEYQRICAVPLREPTATQAEPPVTHETAESWETPLGCGPLVQTAPPSLVISTELLAEAPTAMQSEADEHDSACGTHWVDPSAAVVQTAPPSVLCSSVPFPPVTDPPATHTVAEGQATPVSW
jgi:hypothetical protein